VQVQGERAPGQIIAAIDHFNSHAEPVDVLVITRGGGSADDLAAFSTEQVTRAVAGSRIPTLVAIGHEVDMSLAELAADQRASTPSNAAQLLVPDKKDVGQNLRSTHLQLAQALEGQLQTIQSQLQHIAVALHDTIERSLRETKHDLDRKAQLLRALSPTEAMKRGYAVLRAEGQVIKSVTMKLYNRN
jgi:exodeoxyribonuclease VII large subunit